MPFVHPSPFIRAFENWTIRTTDAFMRSLLKLMKNSLLALDVEGAL